MTTTSANTGLLPERVETAARERIAARLAKAKLAPIRRWSLAWWTATRVRLRPSASLMAAKRQMATRFMKSVRSPRPSRRYCWPGPCSRGACRHAVGAGSAGLQDLEADLRRAGRIRDLIATGFSTREVRAMAACLSDEAQGHARAAFRNCCRSLST
jgi:hypothetical protein